MSDRDTVELPLGSFVQIKCAHAPELVAIGCIVGRFDGDKYDVQVMAAAPGHPILDNNNLRTYKYLKAFPVGWTNPDDEDIDFWAEPAEL